MVPEPRGGALRLPADALGVPARRARVLQFVPVLLLAPWAGSAADRFDRGAAARDAAVSDVRADRQVARAIELAWACDAAHAGSGGFEFASSTGAPPSCVPPMLRSRRGNRLVSRRARPRSRLALRFSGLPAPTHDCAARRRDARARRDGAQRRHAGALVNVARSSAASRWKRIRRRRRCRAFAGETGRRLQASGFGHAPSVPPLLATAACRASRQSAVNSNVCPVIAHGSVGAEERDERRGVRRRAGAGLVLPVIQPVSVAAAGRWRSPDAARPRSSAAAESTLHSSAPFDAA